MENFFEDLILGLLYPIGVLIIIISIFSTLYLVFYKRKNNPTITSPEKKEEAKDSHSPSPTPKKSKGVLGQTIAIIVVITVAIIVIKFAFSFVSNLFSSESKKPEETTVFVDTTYSLYIPKSGKSIFLHKIWKIDPLDNFILIRFPNGRVLKDGPGIENHVGPQQEGWYEISSKSNECLIWVTEKYTRVIK